MRNTMLTKKLLLLFVKTISSLSIQKATSTLYGDDKHLTVEQKYTKLVTVISNYLKKNNLEDTKIVQWDKLLDANTIEKLNDCVNQKHIKGAVISLESIYTLLCDEKDSPIKETIVIFRRFDLFFRVSFFK